MIRIVHCDDSEAYRRLVEVMLGDEGDLEVIASVAEHAQAVDVVQREQPDAVLLDARVPGGTERAASALRSVAAHAAIVVLSGLDDPGAAMREGADALVLKRESFPEIARVVREAVARRTGEQEAEPQHVYGRGAGAGEAIEVVRSIYAAFARRDVDGALVHTAPAVELWPHGTASIVGHRGPYRGHDGVREYFADAARAWDDLSIAAEDFRATGGGVIVFGSISGVSEGRPVRRRVVWVWRVADGLATSMRVTDIGDIVANG